MRRNLNILVLILAAALLSACAIQPPGTMMLVAGERVDMRDVSFVPPTKHPWYVVNHQAMSIDLAAYGERQDETLAIQASYFEMPAMSTAEELAAYLKPQLVTENGERFTLLEHRFTPRTVNDLMCVDTYLDVEDRQAKKRTSRPDPMRLRIAALYCLHPSEKKVGLHIGYSNRHYAEGGEPDLEAVAQRMFETLRVVRAGE